MPMVVSRVPLMEVSLRMELKEVKESSIAGRGGELESSVLTWRRLGTEGRGRDCAAWAWECTGGPVYLTGRWLGCSEYEVRVNGKRESDSNATSRRHCESVASEMVSMYFNQ